MEEKLLIIADRIQIEEFFFVIQFQEVLSHPTPNLLNTFLLHCNTQIGRFLRFESKAVCRQRRHRNLNYTSKLYHEPEKYKQ